MTLGKFNNTHLTELAQAVRKSTVQPSTPLTGGLKTVKKGKDFKLNRFKKSMPIEDY